MRLFCATGLAGAPVSGRTFSPTAEDLSGQPRVAIYCRVSTDDQCCERQEGDLRAFARRAGHRNAFKETASGAKNDRPERKQVMALAQGRQIDAILVTELSR